eukprot:364792-Chlamydomonas_euryale.AAC.17
MLSKYNCCHQQVAIPALVDGKKLPRISNSASIHALDLRRFCGAMCITAASSPLFNFCMANQCWQQPVAASYRHKPAPKDQVSYHLCASATLCIAL